MYSPKLSKFIKENTPAELSLGMAHGRSKILGFPIGKQEVHKPVAIWGNTLGVSTVTYTPNIQWEGAPAWFSSKENQWVLTMAGIVPIVVDLPEKVVQLPIPSWIWAESDDYYSGAHARSDWCFLSEVPHLIGKFEEALKIFRSQHGIEMPL